MLTKHKQSLSSQKGFTIVELIVATVVATILAGVLVAVITAFTQQYSVVSVRQKLNTDAQAAVSLINDDIRNSTGVALYNMMPDSNAPTSLVGDYNNVPGNPEAPTDPQYNWRMGQHRLLLIQPSVDANNRPVYTDADTLSGPFNIVIYYVKNASLYRRVITNTANAFPTLHCTVEATGGCTQGSVVDKKVVSDLNTSSSTDGSSSFVVTYYDRDRNTIEVEPGPDGNPSYSAFTNAQAVAVNLDLGRSQTGTSLIDAKGALTQIRSTSPVQVAQKSLFSSSLVAGPGGIRGYYNSQIFAQTVATSGNITVEWGSTIGSADQPARVVTTNKNCGSGASYGTVTCNTQPVSMSFRGKIFGNLCATGQTSDPSTSGAYASKVSPGNQGTQYTLGYQPNCTAPDTQLPRFDKTSFTAGMTASKQGSNASCNGTTGGSVATLEANTTYTTNNVSLFYGCKGTITGDIYVKNDLDITYGSTLTVAESVTQRPVIVVNGKVNITFGSIIKPNSKGIAPYIISFDSSNATCSNSDTNCCNAFENSGCSPVTFSNDNLRTSVGRQSISLYYGVSAPSTLFHAYYGGIRVFWYGTVRAGALAGQKVTYEYGSNIILDQ